MDQSLTLRERIVGLLPGRGLRQLQETLAQELRQSQFNEEVLTERMAELELALEDANWMRLTLESSQEFSRQGQQKIVELARLMFIKNPLIKRGVMVKALYVWAQGVSVKYKDPDLNKVLQDFWDDAKNRAELTGHQAQLLKEIDMQVESNLFFVFFVRPTDGRVRVRTLPFDEVTEIISDPDDAKTPWYYVRSWTKETITTEGRRGTRQMKVCYPDWKYTPKVRPARISGMEVQWNSPVFHVKSGGMSGWKFGVSEIYAAIDWARAYKEFLEDVASLMRAYSRFAWKRTTKNKKAIAAEKAKMASTLASSGTDGETNPSPVTGAMAFMAEGTNLEPMQLRGASISPDDGRRLLLMVAAAVGLPETYFGDVSVGTFATAKTMDRPTELAMKERQTFWIDTFRSIFDYVMLQAVKAGTLKNGKIKRTVDGNEIEEQVIWNDGVKSMLDIDFPPILEKDVQAAVQAVVTALTLNGQQLMLLDEQTATRLILKAMAEDDVDEIMEELFGEDADRPAGPRPPAAPLSPTATSSRTGEPGSGGDAVNADPRVVEAARKVLEAIQKARKVIG